MQKGDAEGESKERNPAQTVEGVGDTFINTLLSEPWNRLIYRSEWKKIVVRKLDRMTEELIQSNIIEAIRCKNSSRLPQSVCF